MHETRERYRDLAKKSTFFMGKAVCGFKDLDPDLHGMMAAWIQRPTRKKLGLAPRAHLKTSLWTVADSLREIVNDVNIRIAIVNENFDNASAMLTSIAEIVERSPVFQWLFPEVIPDFGEVPWSKSQLRFNRDKVGLKENTVEAFGVGGASTSRHYDLIKEDDLIGKEARESKLVMDKAIDQHKLAEALCSRPGIDRIQTYGTRWDAFDLTQWMLRNESKQLDYLCLSIFRPDGTPIWDRFTPEVVADLRATFGPIMFPLQFENRAVAEGVTELSGDWLRYWHWSEGKGEETIVLERPESCGGPYTVTLDQIEVFELIDAGLTQESTSARTAIVVVGLTGTTPYDVIVLDAVAERISPPKVMQNAQARRERWNPLTLGLEVVGAHLAFYYWALERYPDMPLRKLKTDTHTSKESRIRQVCAPLGDAGRIYVNRQMHDFIEEWTAFPSKSATRDLIDAFSYFPQIGCPPAPAESEYDEDDEDDEQALADGRNPMSGY